MHEAGLMQTALEMACEEARLAGAIRVQRLVLSIGAGSGVEPDALRFAFDALSVGSLADGATLEFEDAADGDALELTRLEVVVP